MARALIHMPKTARAGEVIEIYKEVGLPGQVVDRFELTKMTGTHGIGHTRMATESDVDIRSAHPYWAYPFADVSVVHNGQLTNYFQWKRRLEFSGHRFQSECDSEIIAVYLAEKMADGDSLDRRERRADRHGAGTRHHLQHQRHHLRGAAARVGRAFRSLAEGRHGHVPSRPGAGGRNGNFR